MVSIYRTAPGWAATQTVLLLQQNGFTPNVAGSGVTENMTVMSAGGSASVEIYVPDEQADRAREFLKRWDNYRLISVQQHATAIRKHLIISVIIGVLLGGMISWALARFTMPGFGQFVTATFFSSVVSLVVIGHFWRPRAAGGEFGIRCPKCNCSLAGLSVPRCPECGTEFDETVLDDVNRSSRANSASGGAGSD